MYIRTKDNVYEVVTTERGSDNKLLYIISTSKTENTTDWVHEADVIKKSENLKDLVDNAVYFIDGLFKSMEERKIIWYGAIYTEKGIITVAKTNENGDWELI